MGLMRFIAPPDRITEDTLQQLYLSGFDRIPWQIRARWAQGELIIERGASDSGSLYIPWQVDGHGTFTLATGTLMERSEPYHLPLELARGKLAQIRNQLAEWESVGLVVPDTVRVKLAAATRALIQATCAVDHGSDNARAKANQSIRLGIETSNLVVAAYVEQALSARRRSTAKLPIWLAADLGNSPLEPAVAGVYPEVFNAVSVPLSWREIESSEGKYRWETSDKQVEWAARMGLKVFAGPLVEFNQRRLPDWLALYEDDFESIYAFISDFVKAAVERYRGRVDVWQCAARVNTETVLSLSEEDKIKLAARSIEMTRLIDAKASLVVSFDQPWGEYLSRRRMDFPPLHFADALIRAELGLTGLMLEINLGYYPGGTLPRDPLEFSRQLDFWSVLGVPLYVSLCAPSSSDADPMATRKTRVFQDQWDARIQQIWVARYVPLLLSKPYVHGVVWGHLLDTESHEFPHAGLIDHQRQPKPALRQLAAIRRKLLQ